MTLHVAVAGWLLDAAPSGAHRRLWGILRALPPLLGSDERITILHRPEYPPPETLPGISWHALDLPARPAWRRALAERRCLPAALRELGVDLLEQGFLPLARGLPCPISLTVHDLRDIDGPGRRRPRWLARVALRAAVRRAAAVTVPSRFTGDRLAAACGATPFRCEVIPGGVDLPFSGGGTAPRTPAYFLHVGHLEDRKNLRLLLSAFAGLERRTAARDLPTAVPQLILVGADHGARGDLQRRAAALGIADKVRFHGTVDESELRRLYAGARAVLVPSRYEGFGLPALEGLAAGRPVLVSDCGALPEVVGAYGTVLPAGNAAAWERAMYETASAEPVDSQGRQAHTAQFAWPRVAATTLALWREICGRGQPRARTMAK